jgi:hypothetical protein
MDLGMLAVQAGPCPGVDIIGESLPYAPGGNEAASGLHTWVCGAVQVVENLLAEALSTSRGWNVPAAASPRRSRSPSLCMTMRSSLLE